MVQGCWSTWGARSQKHYAWKRERASAMSLETPETWRALTKKWCFMEISTKNLTKSMMRGSLWMARVDNGNYTLGVTPELQTFAWKLGEPQGTGDYYRKKFLALNDYSARKCNYVIDLPLCSKENMPHALPSRPYACSLFFDSSLSIATPLYSTTTSPLYMSLEAKAHTPASCLSRFVLIVWT